MDLDVTNLHNALREYGKNPSSDGMECIKKYSTELLQTLSKCEDEEEFTGVVFSVGMYVETILKERDMDSMSLAATLRGLTIAYFENRVEFCSMDIYNGKEFIDKVLHTYNDYLRGMFSHVEDNAVIISALNMIFNSEEVEKEDINVH